MTDRELLELAAKAAGIKVKGYFEDEPTLLIKPGIRLPPARWNPLTDDGDALRLAVKLELEISASYDESANVYVGYDDGERIRYVINEKGDDPYAATRRAIVMAAAEIGAGK